MDTADCAAVAPTEARSASQGSVHDWMDAPLHRYSLISPEARVVGYGEATVGAIDVTVLDIGTAAPGTGPMVVYPVPDQSGVPSTFTGNEVPDPLPSGTAYPVGYSVTTTDGWTRCCSDLLGGPQLRCHTDPTLQQPRRGTGVDRLGHGHQPVP